MEFQEGLMRLMIQDSAEKQWQSRKSSNKKSTEKKTTSESERSRKWRIFQRSSTPNSTAQPPSEFLCPITGSLMAEPVIVSSGHTFERSCAEACRALGFSPTMSDSSSADFSSVIPNLALKSTIAAWCSTSSAGAPTPPGSAAAESLVRDLMASSQSSESKCKNIDNNKTEIATEIARRRRGSGYCSSFSSADTTAIPSPKPYSRSSSSSSSSEVETSNPSFLFEEEEILAKMKSQNVSEVEEGLATLRRITRTREEARAHLCTYRLLSTLRSLIPSRYTGVQVNALAALVNLSLEGPNKSKIVRSGIVPPLIDALKNGGSHEAQEHAAAAVFSLALDPDSRTAVGVLGALSPLVRLLRAADSERARQDSASALYHLTMVQTNRAKLVRSGSVPALLGMVRSGHMSDRIMLVLGNLALSPEGRVALMDAGAVECMVELLVTGLRACESAVMVLWALSHGGLRFRALAKAARVAEALSDVVETGSEKARQRAKMVIETLKGRRGEEVEEDVNWEELLESGFESQTPSRVSNGLARRPAS